VVQVLHAPHPKLLGLLLGLGEHFSDFTDQSSAENESRASGRAMIAAAKQIVDEKMAKEVIRPHKPRTKCAEKGKC
jgi:hypothetical protein